MKKNEEEEEEENEHEPMTRRLAPCARVAQAASHLILAASQLLYGFLHHFAVWLSVDQFRDHFGIPKNFKSHF